MFLVIALVFVGSSWLTNVLDIVPTEAPDQVPEWVARLIAGVIAVFSLMTATYLVIKEKKQKTVDQRPRERDTLKAVCHGPCH